jgi:hypothetical protein
MHHIYEFKKGLRNLVLYTGNTSDREMIEEKLVKNNIAYFVHQISSKKINVFFGKKECIEVLRIIGKKKLNFFSPKEDFILGIMLGYDRREQCIRFINKIKKI